MVQLQGCANLDVWFGARIYQRNIKVRSIMDETCNHRLLGCDRNLLASDTSMLAALVQSKQREQRSDDGNLRRVDSVDSQMRNNGCY